MFTVQRNSKSVKPKHFPLTLRTQADVSRTAKARTSRRARRGDSSRKEAPLTFELLCQLSPRLKDFHQMIQMIHDDGTAHYFCANQLWDRLLHDTLEDLVGHHAPEHSDPRLKTSAAFDVARHACYNALPDCRGCTCLAIDQAVSARLRERSSQ